MRWSIHFILFFFVMLSICGSASALLPARAHWIEFNRNLGLYYLCAHILTLVALPFFRQLLSRRLLLVIGIVLSLLVGHYSALLWKYFFYSTAVQERRLAAVAESQPVEFSVLYIDAEDIREEQSLLTSIRAGRFALIGLSNLVPGGVLDQALQVDFPFVARAADPTGVSVLALFSQFPLNSPITDLGEGAPPALIVELQLPNKRRLSCGVLNAPTLFKEKQYWESLVYLRRLTTLFHTERESLLLLGGFQATTFSSLLRVFLVNDRLSEAAYGRGYRSTWHAQRLFSWFDLDHILYRGPLVATAFRRLEPFGGAHFPLAADFRAY